MVSSILAVSDNGAIGNKNALPWPHIKEDLDWFHKRTDHNVVVMGRNTWESLGVLKPLKNRINIVVSSQNLFEGADAVINDNINAEIKKLESLYPDQEIFVTGGAGLYESTAPIVDKFYVTRITGTYEGDALVNIKKMLVGTNLKYSLISQATKKLPQIEFQIWERS